MFSKATPKQRALVIGIIILGTLFTVFFGMRVAHAYKKFNGHRPPPPGKTETDVELIREWMTIPFISELYHVPEKVIFDALQIPPLGNREKSLKDLNREIHPDEDGFVRETVKATITAHNASRPPLPDSTPASVSTPTAPITP